MKPPRFRFLSAAGTLCCFATVGALPPSARAADATWDGGASTNVINDAANWTSDVLPNVSGDTATWNGGVPGNLNLIWTGGFGNQPNGTNFVMSAGQTGNLSLSSNAVNGTSTSGNLLAIGNINVASGAGAFTVGDSVDLDNTVFRNPGGVASNTLTNNSAQTATFASNTRFNSGGGAIRTVTFTGSGDWQVDGLYIPAGTGAFNTVKSGVGTLAFSGPGNGGTFGGTLTVTSGIVQVTGNGHLGNNTFGGAITLTSPGALEYQSSNNQSITGVISGTGSLSQNAGSLTLAASNSYSGATTITGGALTVSGTGSINSTSGIAVNGFGAKYLHTSTVASTVPINLLQGTLDGTGSLGAVTVADDFSAIVTHGNGGTSPLTIGTLTFNGAATVDLNYNGAAPLVISGALTTTPANGQVIIDVPSALPDGTVDLINFGSLIGGASGFTPNLTGISGRQAVGAPFLNGNNIAVTVTGSETIVWTGVTDDLWETATTGDHSGPNNWARKTAQSATHFWMNDTVEFNDTYNLGSGNVAVTRDYVAIHTGVSPVSTTFNNNNVPYLVESFGTGIASGSLTKNGTATTILKGTHIYTGPTTINAGTLQLGDGFFDGTITATSSVTNNGTLLYSRQNNHTAAYPISGSGSLVKAGLGILTLSGANTSTGSTTIAEGAITLTGGGGIGTGALSVATGAALNLNKGLTLSQTTTGGGVITNTTGTTAITGDLSGFAGIYRHSSATSSTNVNTTTGTSATTAYEITVGNTTSQGILTNVLTGDNNFHFGSLSGVANSLVRNGANVTGNTTLQIGNLGTNTEFAGTIGGGGGTLGLTKVGTGTLTLSGPATYSGATQINQGTLELTNTAKALGSSAVTLANGAVLKVKTPAAGTTMLLSASLTLGSGNLTFDFNSLNPTVPQITTGALTVNGNVGVTFQNTNALTTGTYKLVDYTSLSGAGSFPGGSFAVGNRGTATIVNNAIDTSIDLQVTSDTPVWTGLDNGNWVAGPTGPNRNWKLATAGTAVDYLEGDTVRFDDSAAGTTSITVDANVSPHATTFDNSTKAYTVSGAAGIASGSLTKSGTGTTTLLTANTYTGSTTINAGTLQLGNGTVDGTIASTSTVANNGTLTYNWAGNYTAPYAISGTGNLTKAGAGTLTVTGNNTYAGGSSVNQGTVRISNNSALGTGGVSIASGATVSNTNLLSGFANTITGSGAFTAGSGQVAITGNWSGFSGTVTSVPTGDLVFNGGFSSGVATTTSADAAYVNNHNLNNTNGMIVQNQTGSPVTYKLGSYASAVGSNLRNSGAATGSVILEIGNLGTNTIAEGSIGGGAQTISLTKVGAGTLTLAGANTYTGTTLVFSGALNVTGSLAAASVVTVAGGGKLMGTGTVAGTVIAAGTVAPGTSAGTLTTGPASLTGTLAIEVDGAIGDKLVSTGSIDLSGATLTVTPLAGGFTQSSYVIAEGTSITGPFASVPSGYFVNIVAGGAGQQAILTSAAGGGYSTWAATNAGGGLANQDFDLDGVDNGVEYFMNATAGFTSNPAIVGGAVTWPNGGNIPASQYGSEFVVQTSPNLSNWTDVPIGNLTTNTDGPGGSLTYTLPTGAGKVFARLSVTPN